MIACFLHAFSRESGRIKRRPTPLRHSQQATTNPIALTITNHWRQNQSTEPFPSPQPQRHSNWPRHPLQQRLPLQHQRLLCPLQIICLSVAQPIALLRLPPLHKLSKMLLHKKHILQRPKMLRDPSISLEVIMTSILIQQTILIPPHHPPQRKRWNLLPAAYRFFKGGGSLWRRLQVAAMTASGYTTINNAIMQITAGRDNRCSQIRCGWTSMDSSVSGS